jgi:hypothetical protein
MKKSFLPLLLASLALAACGDDARIETVSAPAEPSNAPTYVIESLIFGDEGQFSYVLLRPDLNAGPPIPLSAGREFPDYAPAESIDGLLSVGSGEDPTLMFFSISDFGTWTTQGQLSFGQYTSVPLEANVPVTSSKVYVPFETTNHATYDAESLLIGDEVGAPSDIPLALDGLTARRGYGHLLRGSTLFQPYYYADDAFHTYTETSMISVIDVETDAIQPSVAAPCPHLHITSEDEQGNLYFSNGQGSIAAAVLTPGHPANCFARINAGETTLDPSSVTHFKDLTGGREGSNLFYIGGGKALFNVYHAERDALTATTPFETVDFSANYHLWTLDLNTGAAAMLEGIDYSGGQIVVTRIDDRTLITIPDADYSRTQFFEVTPDAVVTKLFDVEGWAFKTFRLR